MYLKTVSGGARLGLGTTAPDWQLEVEDDTTVRTAVTSTNNGTAGVYFRVFLDGNQVGNGTIATQNNGDMKFFTGTSSESEKMRIASGGQLFLFTRRKRTLWRRRNHDNKKLTAQSSLQNKNI